MSVHFLLNLLNKLGKRDNMPSILYLFRNKFNKFNKIKSTIFKFYLSYDIIYHF